MLSNLYSNKSSFKVTFEDLYLICDSSNLPFSSLIFDFSFSFLYFSSSTWTLNFASVEVILFISSIILSKRYFGFWPFVIELNSASFWDLSFKLLSFSLFKLDIFLSICVNNLFFPLNSTLLLPFYPLKLSSFGLFPL